MEDQYQDELSPSILGTCPLNTPYDQPGSSKNIHSKNKVDEFEIPSYQPQKEDAKPSSGTKKTTKPTKETEGHPSTTFHRSKTNEDGNFHQEIK